MGLQIQALFVDMYERYGPVSAVSLFRVLETQVDRFIDGDQHDAQEFLAFLTDALHEDLNRHAWVGMCRGPIRMPEWEWFAINRTLTFPLSMSPRARPNPNDQPHEVESEAGSLADEMPQMCIGNENENENEGERAWRQHRLRHNSVMVDNFQGMLKSVVVCSECQVRVGV